MEFLVNYFNSIKDRLTIVLISRCWSAGTDLLVSYKGKIIINHSEMDSFVFHIPSSLPALIFFMPLAYSS